MANRFFSPFEQLFDASTGDFLSGGRLFFYVTGTTTPAPTYANAILTVSNPNPVVLNSAGRHTSIFLDSSIVYKVVLAGPDLTLSTTDVPPTNVIMTADPVVDPAANVTAAFQVFAGNPNGSVAGSAGTVGGSGASVVWDITNDLLYVCITSGGPSTAVWKQIGGDLAGQVTQTGRISPAQLVANTDDWNPTGLDTASVIRISSNANRDLTGIVAQPEGTLLTIHNIGSFNITMKRQNSGSTAANRFLFHDDVILRPDVSVTLRYDGLSSRWRPTTMAEARFSSGMLFGLTLADGTDTVNDIDIATGKCRDSTDEENMVLASILTKQLDVAWAVGTGNGGRDTGAIANTTYHVWLIKRSDTGVVDALFSTSATAPTMPTNYDFKRRIGSIVRAGATIVQFTQNADEFLLAVPLQDISTTDPGTSAVLPALTIPLGIKVNAVFSVAILSPDDRYVLITSQDQTNTAPTSSLYDLTTSNAPSVARGAARFNVRTNTTAQIRYRFSASDGSTTINIVTHGWVDTRGRLN